MPGPAGTPAEHAPRRARYLVPQDTRHRGEIVTAIAAAVLVTHLVLAPLAIVLAAGLYLTGRLTRWRATWLAVPAAAGLFWALAAGPVTAAGGAAAEPRQVMSYLGGIGDHPSRLLHLTSAFSGPGQWLPRQLPVAVILAAAEAAVWAWLTWLHTEEADLAPPRPGLVTAVRRRYTTVAVRDGGVVSRHGGRLGTAPDGRSAGISWAEAEGGVLAAGQPAPQSAPGTHGWAGSGSGHLGAGSSVSGRLGRGGAGAGRPGVGGPAPFGPGPAATGFQLVHAAIRRRKPVIVVDLAGEGSLPAALTPVCQAAGAPLDYFGAAGQTGPGSFYDPLRGSDPARAAALVTGMADWSGLTEPRRRACAAYLGDLFTVRGAAPADPRQPVLQDVVQLLDPAVLRARLQRVPAHYPHRAALTRRVASSAAAVDADPGGLADIAGQLLQLQSAPAGRWLAPGRQQPGGQQPGGHQLSLGRVVRERGVCLFALDPAQDGPAAGMIARLVAFDAMALCADLCGTGVSGDGLVWFNGCEQLDRAVLAELIARGRRAGVAVVLSTTSDRAAASLAADVNVLAVHPLADQAAACQLATLASGGTAPVAPFPAPLGPGVPVAAAPEPAGYSAPSAPGPVGLVQAGLVQAGPAQASPAQASPAQAAAAGVVPQAPVPRPVPAWALRMPAPSSPVPPALPASSGQPTPSGLPASSGPPVQPGRRTPSGPPASSDQPYPAAPSGPPASARTTAMSAASASPRPGFPSSPSVPPGLADPPFSSGPPLPRGSQLPPAPFADLVFPVAAAAWDAGSAGAAPLQNMNHPVIAPESLLTLRGDSFALIVKGPEWRVSLRCRAVPARLPEGPA